MIYENMLYLNGFTRMSCPYMKQWLLKNGFPVNYDYDLTTEVYQPLLKWFVGRFEALCWPTNTNVSYRCYTKSRHKANSSSHLQVLTTEVTWSCQFHQVCYVVFDFMPTSYPSKFSSTQLQPSQVTSPTQPLPQ